LSFEYLAPGFTGACPGAPGVSVFQNGEKSPHLFLVSPILITQAVKARLLLPGKAGSLSASSKSKIN